MCYLFYEQYMNNIMHISGEKEQGYEQKAERHFFLGVVFFGNAGRMQQHNI